MSHTLTPDTDAAPVLLYDGTCGFCAESVQLVLKHDRTKVLRFAALDSDFGRAVLQRHPELAGIDSVLWVEPSAERTGPERILTQSTAALRVAAYLGGAWRLATVAALVPRGLRDALYRLVAKHRHRLPGGRQCLVPSVEERTRFLA
jgi:predicted DCC family thiol-disulfide oxidoreductase YuxK